MTRIRLACLCVAALALTGCGYAVGPTSKQSLAGQETTNSALNEASFIDDPGGSGSGTTNVRSSGPVMLVEQNADGTKLKGSGLMPTVLSLKREDGSGMSLSSPNDTSGEVTTTLAGETKVVFDTRASPVMAQYVNLEEKVGAVKIGMSADQRAVWQTISNDQRDTILGVAEKVLDPNALAALAKLLAP